MLLSCKRTSCEFAPQRGSRCTSSSCLGGYTSRWIMKEKEPRPETSVDDGKGLVHAVAVAEDEDESQQRAYWARWDAASDPHVVLEQRASYMSPCTVSSPRDGLAPLPAQEDAEWLAQSAFSVARTRIEVWREESHRQERRAQLCLLAASLVALLATVGIGILAKRMLGAGVVLGLVVVSAVPLMWLAIDRVLMQALRKVGRRGAVAQDVQAIWRPFNERLSRELPRYHLRARAEKASKAGLESRTWRSRLWKHYMARAPNWVVVMELLTDHDVEAAAAAADALEQDDDDDNSFAGWFASLAALFMSWVPEWARGLLTSAPSGDEAAPQARVVSQSSVSATRESDVATIPFAEAL